MKELKVFVLKVIIMAKAIKEPIFPECPIRNVLARICDKWSMLVIFMLEMMASLNGRFNPGNRVPVCKASVRLYRGGLGSCTGTYGKAIGAQEPGSEPFPLPQPLASGFSVCNADSSFCNQDMM